MQKVFRTSDPAEREELLKQMTRLPGNLLEPVRRDIETLSTDAGETENTRRLARELKTKLDESP